VDKVKFKMTPVYIAADNITSPIGFTTRENFDNLLKGKSGISVLNENNLLPKVISASLMNTDDLDSRFSKMAQAEKYTRFEKLAMLSLSDCMSGTGISLKDKKTLFILSTTKGSIDVLESRNNHFENDRLYLWKSAQVISGFFGNTNTSQVVSCACVSGVTAINTATMLIRSGEYDNVVITGADIITRFVASGFSSFMALSDNPCMPFDKKRNGLNLGEAAGTIILTKNKNSVTLKKTICIGKGFSANDASHISAPSRTGEGLYKVISKLKSDFSNSIDFISAHGTATIYNDEMEATAVTRAGMEDVPLNSFKGYWGHTLGAAGVIETIASAHSIIGNKLIKTAGFSEQGTTSAVSVINETRDKELRNCLKLASGFGGSNAGLILYNE